MHNKSGGANIQNRGLKPTTCYGFQPGNDLKHVL